MSSETNKYLNLAVLEHYDAKLKQLIDLNIVSEFSSSATYTVGTYVTHEGRFYKCTTAVTTAGAWDDVKTSFTAVKIMDVINELVHSVEGTSPVSVTTSNNKATVSLANGYGDTKNPYGSKTKNYVLAAPANSNGNPSFRALVAEDIPNLDASKITSGTFDVARIPSLDAYVPKSVVTAAGDLIVGSGDGAVTKLAKGENGKFLTIANGSLVWGDTVSANDGKLTINGATSSDKIEFTANQSGNTSGTINKAFIGLGSVVNAGQSSTPTESSTDYFTAGGAYSLKSDLEEQIKTQASHFRGSWATWSSVPSDSSLYPADADGSKIPTANDYMIVEDASGYPVASGDPALSGTWRFVYVGVWTTNGKNGWLPAYKIESPTLTFKTIDSTNTSALSTDAAEVITGSGTINLHKIAKTGTYSDLIGKPESLKNPNAIGIKVNSESSAFVTYDGSAAKTITVKPSTTAGALIISDGTTDKTIQLAGSFTDNNYYPTTFAWTNGTTGGPTGSLTGSGMSAVSFGAIPSASDSQSGIVTTGAQTFAGAKTFNTSIVTPGITNGNGASVGFTANTNKITISSTDEDIEIHANKDVDVQATTGDVTIGAANNVVVSAGTGDKAYYYVGTVPSTMDATREIAVKADIPTVPTGFTITANATDGIFDLTGTNGTNAVTYALAPYSAETASSTWVSNNDNAGKFYLGTQNPSKTTRLNYNGYLYAKKLYSEGKEVITDIPVTDVQVNGSSIISNKIANLITNTAYNSSTNKIATMSDIPSVSLTQSSSGSGTSLKTTTTWGLDSTSIAFESITEAEIDALFA